MKLPINIAFPLTLLKYFHFVHSILHAEFKPADVLDNLSLRYRTIVRFPSWKGRSS